MSPHIPKKLEKFNNFVSNAFKVKDDAVSLLDNYGYGEHYLKQQYNFRPRSTCGNLFRRTEQKNDSCFRFLFKKLCTFVIDLLESVPIIIAIQCCFAKRTQSLGVVAYMLKQSGNGCSVD